LRALSDYGSVSSPLKTKMRVKGASPAELPIEQPTQLEMVINLRTAKALGLTVSPSVLARADRVIQ
jgi:putative ABC transport system substrate-binding protein